jgi:hypothetical protein
MPEALPPAEHPGYRPEWRHCYSHAGFPSADMERVVHYDVTPTRSSRGHRPGIGVPTVLDT